jgi:hypothetical protein
MMGKYDRSYVIPETTPNPPPVHPIWRAIGCLLMVLFPILSYAGAVLLVRENIRRRWIPVPAELAGSVVVPYLGRVYFLDLAVTVLLLIVGFSLLMVFYAMISRLIGPPRYGPYDVPPPRQRRR